MKNIKFITISIIFLIVSGCITAYIAYQKAVLSVYTDYRNTVPGFWSVPVQKIFFTYNLTVTVDEKGEFWSVKEKSTGNDYKIKIPPQLSITIGKGPETYTEWKVGTDADVSIGDKISLHGAFHPTENYFIPTLLFLYKP